MHTIPVKGRYAVNHSQMRLRGVMDGLGIGIFPDFVIKQALKEGEVKPVLEDWTIKGNYQGDIALQFAQTKFMPARLRVFIDYVAEHMANIPKPPSPVSLVGVLPIPPAYSPLALHHLVYTKRHNNETRFAPLIQSDMYVVSYWQQR